MSETYTHGTWTVKAGEEDAFVEEWTGFVTWASSMPGFESFEAVDDLRSSWVLKVALGALTRRIQLNVRDGAKLPDLPSVVDVAGSGSHAVTVTTSHYTPDLLRIYEHAGVSVHEVQRMSLEEIFVASVMSSRKERTK